MRILHIYIYIFIYAVQLSTRSCSEAPGNSSGMESKRTEAKAWQEVTHTYLHIDVLRHLCMQTHIRCSNVCFVMQVAWLGAEEPACQKQHRCRRMSDMCSVFGSLFLRPAVCIWTSWTVWGHIFGTCGLHSDALGRHFDDPGAVFWDPWAHCLNS